MVGALLRLGGDTLPSRFQSDLPRRSVASELTIAAVTRGRLRLERYERLLDEALLRGLVCPGPSATTSSAVLGPRSRPRVSSLVLDKRRTLGACSVAFSLQRSSFSRSPRARLQFRRWPRRTRRFPPTS